MPLIVDDESPALDSTRLSFRERLRSGRVVPIVSDEVVFNRMMGGYQPFLASYVRYVKFNTRSAWWRKANMANELIYASGINGETGEPLLPLVKAAVVVPKVVLNQK